MSPAMPGFVNGSFSARSPFWDAERTINLYVEGRDGGTPKSAAYLIGTPALYPFVGAGNGPVRQMFAQDGRGFAVSGAYFVEFFETQTAQARGTVLADGRMATICSNGQAGQQLFIVSAGLGYIYNLTTNILTQITDPAFPAFCQSGLFFDQYFIALDRDTGEFFLSDLDDGLSWNGIDFGAESQFSDTVIAMSRTTDNLVLYGTKNTGFWYNSGNASFPFQPIPGAVTGHGTGAPFGGAVLDNTTFFLMRDALGSAMVMRFNGYTPQRISTHPLETYLNSAPQLDDTVGWAYQEEGHTFFGLRVPGLATTPVYDVASGLWCERAHWNTTLMQWEPWRPLCHAYAFGRHLWGDSQTGTIYESSLSRYADQLVG